MLSSLFSSSSSLFFLAFWNHPMDTNYITATFMFHDSSVLLQDVSIYQSSHIFFYFLLSGSSKMQSPAYDKFF